jgi:cytidine deaminase
LKKYLITSFNYLEKQNPNMVKKTINIEYTAFANTVEMAETDRILINRAIEIAKLSYSPYSKFPVGAAVMLDSGEIFAGNNQENIAFPSGTCAERTVLNYVNANFPDKKIKTIAITATNTTTTEPVTPCGFCRQVIVEMEMKQKSPLRIILHKIGGETYVFETSKAILPLAFDDNVLKN